MKKLTIPKKFLEKRIPTILGVSVLVIALIAGTLLIGQGGGIFAPRASAETTPKKVKITNVHDTSFTISFLTDNKTAGFVKYGTETNSVRSQSGDDRDQISGTVGEFQLHHVTVRGLQQNTTYYYTIGTGSGNIFDDNGQPFRIKTASRNGAPAAAKTIYGSVTDQAGAPANGSVVYVDVDGAGTMSSQVKASGSWAIPLSNARTKDGSAYAEIVDDDDIIINVQGPLSSQVASFKTSTANAQPVAEITFGQNGIAAATAAPTVAPTLTPTLAPTVAPTPKPTADSTESAKAPTDGSNLDSLLDEDLDSSASATVAITQIDLDSEEPQTVTTSNPVIIGKAPMGTTVSIVVNSDTQIQQDVVADENGEFTLDISQLSESLEPGEHTATYSYTDPTTGEIIEKTVSFTVDNTVEQLALAENTESSPAPFGSGNPYPIETPIPASDSATATDEARTTVVATDEAVPVSGSVGTTLALVFGGLFFIISGLWSFWISTQLEKGELEV